jgi:hypothetical protein
VTPQARQARDRPVARGKRHARIVRLHDERDAAIDDSGDADADGGENRALEPDRVGGHRSQRDGHDLGREDEVRLDGAAHLLVLEIARVLHRGRDRGFVLVGLVGPEDFEDLLGPLVAEEGAADHQKRRDQGRRQRAKKESGRQEVEQLVLERTPGDPPDDRQFAVGGEADHVARRDGRVVDDDPRRP